MNYLLNPPPVVWPLLALLVVLFLLRQASSEVKPIVRGVVAGVAANAKTNAAAYATAFCYGLTASISAFIDVFKDMSAVNLGTISWHQYAVLWAKVLNPFVVAILAYTAQSKFALKAAPGETIETTATTSKTTSSQGTPLTP